MNIFDRIQTAVRFLQETLPQTPKVGLIMGSGQTSFPDKLTQVYTIPFKDIPYFTNPSVISHEGLVHFGYIDRVPVIVLGGRLHAYEGAPMQDIVFPTRVLKFLGAEVLILTNAAGGLNPAYKQGDLVLIEDHINLMFKNPLRGPNDQRLGTRFPDMSEAYDLDLRKKARQTAKSINIRLAQGIYAAMLGPSLETKAEYQFLHLIGADLVGMSTVPEVIAANHIGLPVLAISVVSNQCYPVSKIGKTKIEDVIKVVAKASKELNYFLYEFISQW